MIIMIYICLAVFLLVSETEPYWNNEASTVTRHRAWFTVNCTFCEDQVKNLTMGIHHIAIEPLP